MARLVGSGMENNPTSELKFPVVPHVTLPRRKHKGNCDYTSKLRFSMGVIEIHLCEKCNPCTCVNASIGFQPIIHQTEHCKVHGKNARQKGEGRR